MIKYFTNNIGAKLVCLILAFSFWTYVVSGEAKVDNFPGSLVLEVKNRPENLVVIKDTSEIEIRIMADRGDWKTLSSQSFEAYIDLSGLGQGTHEVSVNVKTDAQNVQIVEVKPAKIMVSMEPVVSKTVKVKEKIDGNAADGMIAKNVKINPDSVDLSGPQSILDQIDQSNIVITLDNEDKDFKKNYSVKAFDEGGNEYKNIVFNPKDVEAEVIIVKAAQTKTLGIKVNTEGRVANGYWINQITSDPSTITVAGSASNLTDVNYLETETINIDGISSDKSQKINLKIPEGLNLIDNQSNKVNIDFKVNSISSSKQMVVGYNYNNLSDALRVSTIDPSIINIILTGLASKLNNALDSEVKINLDLSSYNQPGTYTIDITDRMFSKPDGLTISTFVPSSIRITLDKK